MLALSKKLTKLISTKNIETFCITQICVLSRKRISYFPFIINEFGYYLLPFPNISCKESDYFINFKSVLHSTSQLKCKLKAIDYMH